MPATRIPFRHHFTAYFTRLENGYIATMRVIGGYRYFVGARHHSGRFSVTCHQCRRRWRRNAKPQIFLDYRLVGLRLESMPPALASSHIGLRESSSRYLRHYSPWSTLPVRPRCTYQPGHWLETRIARGACDIDAAKISITAESDRQRFWRAGHLAIKDLVFHFPARPISGFPH